MNHVDGHIISDLTFPPSSGILTRLPDTSSKKSGFSGASQELDSGQLQQSGIDVWKKRAPSLLKGKGV
jgi:hypothetical protein